MHIRYVTYNYMISIYCYLYLGTFYYTIANIKHENRSRTNAIQILALITSPLLKKYGPDAILDKFITELRELER
jgi:hypothetical protein